MESEREREYILHRGASMIADYFRNRIIYEYSNHKVAVLIKTFLESLYFLPCNERGYPLNPNFKTIEFKPLEASIYSQSGEIPTSNITVTEYTIWVEKPLVLANLPNFDSWMREPQVFLWEGKILDTKKIPIENLNIKELMVLAQEAIKKREGIIIDVAMNNKSIN